MTLNDTIKKLVSQTIANMVPTKVMYGEVKTVSPLSILVDGRFLLDGDELVLPKDITLTAGDKAVMVRDLGGQQYLIVGRV